MGSSGGHEEVTSLLAWEDVACPLCEARQEELVLAAAGAGGVSCRVVRCRRCGLGYLIPRPDEATIHLLYPDDYAPYQPPCRRRQGWWGQMAAQLRRLVHAHYLGDPPPLRRWHQKALAVAAGPWLRPDRASLLALPFHGEGRLLDFGCGSGWYAYRLYQRGWQATGMDFSAHAARQARESFGLPTLVGSLPHPEVLPESFDVITMGAVLEHVHRPRQVIRAAAEALRPGGRLVVSVPNLASWGFRYFGADWWGLQLPHHLLHFTPASLTRLLEDGGLRVEEVRFLARAGWMRRSLATARRGAARGRWLVRLGRLRVAAHLLTRWTVQSGQGDCLLAVATRPPAAGLASRPAA